MRLRPTVQRSAALASAAVLLVTLGGCGVDEGESSETSLASSTASSTPDPSEEPSKEPSAAAEGEKIDPQAFADLLLASFEESTTAAITMSMTASGLKVSGEGFVDYSDEKPAISLSMTNAALGEGRIEMRMVDGVAYVSMPGLGAGRFIEIDAEQLAGEAGVGLDPREALESFVDGVERVQLIGEDEVDGDDVRHYTLTVDSTKIDGAQQLPEGERLPQDLAYDVWLDDDDRIRRMSMDLGASGALDMTMSDWGTPVTIKAPPAEEVIEMPEGMLPTT